MSMTPKTVPVNTLTPQTSPAKDVSSSLPQRPMSCPLSLGFCRPCDPSRVLVSHGLPWDFHVVGRRHMSCFLPLTPCYGWSLLRVAAAPQAHPASSQDHGVPQEKHTPVRRGLLRRCLSLRFVFILLGPRAKVKACHEVGRAMATLLTDEVSLVQHPGVG